MAVAEAPGDDAQRGAFVRFLKSARMRFLLNIVQKVMSVAVVLFLGIKLYRIGWADITAGLPHSAAFYIAFAAQYLTGVLGEVYIYGGLWGIGLAALPIFLRKRIYNEVVIDYSGEAYLYLWAKRTLGLQDGRLLSAIKDVNLLSGVASNSMTLILLAAFAAGGYVTLLQGVDPNLLYAVAGAASLAILVMLTVVLFGHRIFALSRGQAVHIGFVHFLRIALVLVLQAVQWGSALPQVPLSQWLMFLTAQMLLTRLPFLPNRDVMLMWLGITLAPAIAAPQSHVALMFVTAGALSLLTHAVVFAVTALIQQPSPKVLQA